MKAPSGRQLQVWFRNEVLEEIQAKAERLSRPTAWVIRESVLLVLNNPNVVWIDGTPTFNPQKTERK